MGGVTGGLLSAPTVVPVAVTVSAGPTAMVAAGGESRREMGLAVTLFVSYISYDNVIGH